MSIQRTPDIPPQDIPRTGDDTPAVSVWGYLVRMSGWHQVWACVLAVIVAVLNLVPIELQRRMVDDAVMNDDGGLLVTLGLVYLAVVLLHQSLKFGLRVYQGWMAESATLYTRRHLLGLYERGQISPQQDSGSAVAVITTEADKLGGFVGEAPSQAASNLAILLGVIGYMLVVAPQIAVLSIALLIPQIILTPVVQSKLNELIAAQVVLLRNLGDWISADARNSDDVEVRVRRIYRNRIQLFIWKYALKSVLNTLNLLAPLIVLVWGGWLVLKGETTVGVLVAFISALNRISDPIRQLITFYRNAAKANVHHDMIARWMRV